MWNWNSEEMELVLNKTTVPIPEKWIRRWRLLSNIREDIGTTSVPWNTTSLSTVQKWVKLNEAMDKAEKAATIELSSMGVKMGSHNSMMEAYESILKSKSDAVPYPNNLTGLDDNYDLSLMRLVRRASEGKGNQFLMSELYDILQYMDSVDDRYMLHMVIDESLSFNRRKEMYEKMGVFMTSHLYPPNPEIPSTTDMVTILYLMYYRTIEREEVYRAAESDLDVTRELDDLVESINKLPYIRLIGIFASAFNYTSFKGHENLQHYNAPNDLTYLLNVNWDDVRDMIFNQKTSALYLEGSSSIPLPGDMVKYSDTTAGSKLIVYTRDTRRLVHMLPDLNLYANTLKLLAGVPMYNECTDVDPLRIFDSDTLEVDYANYQNNPAFSPEGVQQLLEAIDKQVDITPPARLIWLAWFVLGLGPILDTQGKYRPIQDTSLMVPLYAVLLPKMSRRCRRTDQDKNKLSTEDYPRECKYLLQTMGSFYLTTCAKCLLRVLEWEAEGRARLAGIHIPPDTKERIESFAEAILTVLEESPDVPFNKFPEKR